MGTGKEKSMLPNCKTVTPNQTRPKNVAPDQTRPKNVAPGLTRGPSSLFFTKKWIPDQVRHDSHAGFVLDALRAGKHVFVEKPLCLTLGELEEISAAYEAAGPGSDAPLLMVGFNRRFAPQVVKIKELLLGLAESKSFIMTVNAGAIPVDHWTQDPAVVGGRIIGEACHFIDLLRFLVGVECCNWIISGS